ncbi:MAG: class I SAM-dependent methyltransferase [Gaiellales bacterium]
MTDLPDHVARNRRQWDSWAADYVEAGERSWAGEPKWGLFGIADTEVGVLPASLVGIDTIELGCGTGYVSAWLARRGARPVGIDNSEQQLATARRLQDEHGIAFPLHHGNAEQTPFADDSFDLAISEYGASIWCDPHAWIPEAARILRPGGELIFLVNSVLSILCLGDNATDVAADRLVRPQRGMHRFSWPDDDSVEFHLSHGDQLRLLRSCGFEVEDIIELYVPPDATTRYSFMTSEWASQWPVEEIWRARLRG